MSTSPEDLVGRTLDGRYRVESIAARGGMATIYLAIDLRLQRAVAVKVMHSALAEDKNFITRFEREARAAAALTHPNVVSVHDQGRDEKTGAMYLVMELVAGYTVRDALSERGNLTAIQSLAVLDPVLQALDAAAKSGPKPGSRPLQRATDRGQDGEELGAGQPRFRLIFARLGAGRVMTMCASSIYSKRAMPNTPRWCG